MTEKLAKESTISCSSLWLSPNPSKRWGELFFLCYTPFWLTLCLGIVVPYKLYESFTELEYLLLGLVSAVPSFLIPMLLVGKKMVVRIRLERLGCRNHPFYRVMAADSRSPRDGKHLEVLGYYNPVAGQDDDKRMGINFERIRYWLSVGAQPSDTVQHILFRAGLLPPPSMVAMGRKGGPCDTHLVDPLTGPILTPETLSKPDEQRDSGSKENNGKWQESIFHIGLQDKQHGIAPL